MTVAYLRHAKTNKRYRIVSIDRRKNTVVLASADRQFTEPYDKERFQRLGYVLETEEPTDAVQPKL